MTLRSLFSLFTLAVLALSFGPAVPARASAPPQAVDPLANARRMLEEMTPEERVGQLFLVTFVGPKVDENSQVYDLITRHHVGGVVLLAENDNFVEAPDTVAVAHQLVAQLQSAEWQASRAADAAVSSAHYVPLFIGISQNGDGYPNDQILGGLTTLPNLMAIGATWDPSLAEQVGQVTGQELSSLGFNLYFGPALDVLESPEATLGNGLGASVFGGDPYWVGALGSAYISGLHTGSGGRMVVIANHFPGRGSSDRPTGEEPATVRKSLEQLKQIELAPYFSVTGNAQASQGAADGLLVSHIRYQGFQGNIRATTRPVSLDPQALSQILSLPAFTTWRGRGGLIVSDDLGSQTVRRFYDPGGQAFLARLVARDAFLAGNDLLYMGNIVSSDMPDNYTTILRSLEFFTQKYREDPAFAQRVDDSVLRILAAKYRAYGEFDPAVVIPSEDGLAALGSSTGVTFEVARRSATLVSPEAQDLDAVLPAPPGTRDRIVFLTDTRPGRQCTSCAPQPILAVDALQNAVLRLYGPQGGGQVLNGRLISYSMESLAGILDSGVTNQELETSLRQASWIVINMLDAEPGRLQTTLLRRFLSERQDLLRDKNVIVFAFNAPYYLDATDISKLTAYYCLYSKSAPFVEVAARLLFQELSPPGDPPVSVSGVGYDLFAATTPDPDQVIELFLDLPPVPSPDEDQTPEPTPTPSFRIGDTFSVRTGVILDRNGHPVPDGTGVRFTVAMSGEGGVIQQVDAVTSGGVAHASFGIDRAGLLELRVTSDPALTSVVLQLDVSSEGFSVTVVAPTSVAGPTPTPDAGLAPGGGNGRSALAGGSPGFAGWFVMLLLLGGLGYLVYRLGDRYTSTRWSVRWVMCTAVGGLLAYSYLAMRLPGAAAYLQQGGWLGLVVLVLIGGGTGFGAAYAWLRLERARR